jgi:hypothetical protein
MRQFVGEIVALPSAPQRLARVSTLRDQLELQHRALQASELPRNGLTSWSDLVRVAAPRLAAIGSFANSADLLVGTLSGLATLDAPKRRAFVRSASRARIVDLWDQLQATYTVLLTEMKAEQWSPDDLRQVAQAERCLLDRRDALSRAVALPTLRDVKSRIDRWMRGPSAAPGFAVGHAHDLMTSSPREDRHSALPREVSAIVYLATSGGLSPGEIARKLRLPLRLVERCYVAAEVRYGLARASSPGRGASLPTQDPVAELAVRLGQRGLGPTVARELAALYQAHVEEVPMFTRTAQVAQQRAKGQWPRGVIEPLKRLVTSWRTAGGGDRKCPACGSRYSVVN